MRDKTHNASGNLNLNLQHQNSDGGRFREQFFATLIITVNKMQTSGLCANYLPTNQYSLFYIKIIVLHKVIALRIHCIVLYKSHWFTHSTFLSCVQRPVFRMEAYL